MDAHPNRIFEYLTEIDRQRGYEEWVLSALILMTGMSIVESEEFHMVCDFSRRKKVHPVNCAKEIIKILGWESQVEKDGHVS